MATDIVVSRLSQQRITEMIKWCEDELCYSPTFIRYVSAHENYDVSVMRLKSLDDDMLFRIKFGIPNG